MTINNASTKCDKSNDVKSTKHKENSSPVPSHHPTDSSESCSESEYTPNKQVHSRSRLSKLPSTDNFDQQQINTSNNRKSNQCTNYDGSHISRKLNKISKELDTTPKSDCNQNLNRSQNSSVFNNITNILEQQKQGLKYDFSKSQTVSQCRVESPAHSQDTILSQSSAYSTKQNDKQTSKECEMLTTPRKPATERILGYRERHPFTRINLSKATCNQSSSIAYSKEHTLPTVCQNSKTSLSTRTQYNVSQQNLTSESKKNSLISSGNHSPLQSTPSRHALNLPYTAVQSCHSQQNLISQSQTEFQKDKISTTLVKSPTSKLKSPHFITPPEDVSGHHYPEYEESPLHPEGVRDRTPHRQYNIMISNDRTSISETPTSTIHSPNSQMRSRISKENRVRENRNNLLSASERRFCRAESTTPRLNTHLSPSGRDSVNTSERSENFIDTGNNRQFDQGQSPISSLDRTPRNIIPPRTRVTNNPRLSDLNIFGQPRVLRPEISALERLRQIYTEDVPYQGNIFCSI